MSRIRRISSLSLFLTETKSKTLKLHHCFFPSLALEDDLDFTSPFDSITDLIQIDRTPFYTSTRRVQHRLGPDSYLQTLCHRVSALEELTFDRLVNAKPSHVGGDRKYTWTAEIKGTEKSGVDKKYELTAEIKGDKKKEKEIKGGVEKWTAEIKDKVDARITKTWLRLKALRALRELAVAKAMSRDAEERQRFSEKIIDLLLTVDASFEDAADLMVRAAKGSMVDHEEDGTAGVEKSYKYWTDLMVRAAKGSMVDHEEEDSTAGVDQKSYKWTAEIKDKDAPITKINYTFQTSTGDKVLRALRELAVARAMSSDAEERQRFSEKIIDLLLLTVDASFEDAHLMVRAAKRSMVDEEDGVPATSVAEVDQENGGTPGVA